jgi:hypothetical protein
MQHAARPPVARIVRHRAQSRLRPTGVYALDAAAAALLLAWLFSLRYSFGFFRPAGECVSVAVGSLVIGWDHENDHTGWLLELRPFVGPVLVPARR